MYPTSLEEALAPAFARYCHLFARHLGLPVFGSLDESYGDNETDYHIASIVATECWYDDGGSYPVIPPEKVIRDSQ